MAAAAGQFALAGAITGAGNAALQGRSGIEIVGQGIIGASTSVLGGIVSGPVSGAVSTQLSKVVGSTATQIATQVVTSAAVGGAMGAGMSWINGGSAWDGFLSGMRTGAISGAISSAVPAAINAMKKPKPVVPQETQTQTVTQEPTVKTEQPGPANSNGKSLKYSVVADRFEGRTVPDLIQGATLDRGSFVAEGGLNLFKFGKPTTTASEGWKTGDRMLLMYDKGSPKLNWKQNSGFLRREMQLGKPIFDSYRYPNGKQIPTGGFLNAERNLLQSRGWRYNSSTGAYHPPK